jgi:hypothetical protein
VSNSLWGVCGGQCCGSGSRIRCPFDPGIRNGSFPDPGSRIPDPNPYFWDLSDIIINYLSPATRRAKSSWMTSHWTGCSPSLKFLNKDKTDYFALPLSHLIIYFTSSPSGCMNTQTFKGIKKPWCTLFSLFAIFRRYDHWPTQDTLEQSLTNFFAFLRAESGKNIHFPARGSASGALAAFYQKICLNTVRLTMAFG